MFITQFGQVYRKTPLAAVIAAAAFFAAPSARADLIISIASPNADLTGTGPYATLDINLVDPTHATFTFTSLTNGGFTYLMGGAGTAALNVNGAYSLSAVTETNSFVGFTPDGILVVNNPGNVDGFGLFNLSLDNFDGFSYAGDFVQFTLTAVGTSWASEADVLTPNGSGLEAAIHAFECPVTCNQAEGATATGYAAVGGIEGGGGGGGGTGGAVPEPPTMLIFGASLVGLALLQRRRA
jgi:hypothetical protein